MHIINKRSSETRNRKVTFESYVPLSCWLVSYKPMLYVPSHFHMWNMPLQFHVESPTLNWEFCFLSVSNLLFTGTVSRVTPDQIAGILRNCWFWKLKSEKLWNINRINKLSVHYLGWIMVMLRTLKHVFLKYAKEILISQSQKEWDQKDSYGINIGADIVMVEE